MRLITCPEQLNTLLPGKSVFLAGGITGCPDWQTDITKYIAMYSEEANINLVNPRRSNFDITNINMSKEQIEWEHRHLLLTDLKLFWFPKETLCPITLFELAYCAQRGDDVVVGIEKGYQRDLDVREQLKHLRPDIPIVQGIFNLGDATLNFLKKKYGKNEN